MVNKFYRISVKPHQDIELGIERTLLEYFITMPIEEINAETGILLSIPGFGGVANSEYHLQKLSPYLATKYNCIVVSINYFGIFRGDDTELNSSFVEQMEELYGVPQSDWNLITTKNDIFKKIVQVLKDKGIFKLDPRCQMTKITGRDEYQSFGFLPALDCLTALADVLKRFPGINKKKVIAYGSSYGGYLAMLCGKYAPHTFSLIIDNSGFSKAEIKYIAGNETLLEDYKHRYKDESGIYTFIASYNNPWTILDETSQNYFGDSHKLIRNLLVGEHRVTSEARYYMFHCEQDEIASVRDKDMAAAVISQYNSTYYKRVSEKDIDGVLFKEYKHSMNASLRKLFDLVAEQDVKDGLQKQSASNDFTANATHIFNCGDKDYIFEFKEDYSLNVRLHNKVKTEYALIKQANTMAQIIELCDFILNVLEQVKRKVEKKKYKQSGVDVEEILGKYDMITKLLEDMVTLPMNNNEFLNNDLINELSKLIDLYERGMWNTILPVLITNVIPAFTKWCAELSRVFEPYLKRKQEVL